MYFMGECVRQSPFLSKNIYSIKRNSIKSYCIKSYCIKSYCIKGCAIKRNIKSVDACVIGGKG